VRRVLAGHLAQLASLSVDDVRCLLDLAVDELLVRGVDERDSEEGGGADQCETPVRNDLDEPVGDKRSEEGLPYDIAISASAPRNIRFSLIKRAYRGRRGEVLGKYYALSLNDEEVDQLVDIADHGIQSLTRDSVVFPGSQLAGKTVVKDGPTDHLGRYGDAEHHPCELEAPSHHVQVPNQEDERDNRGVCDSRGTCREGLS
jgi:hypothetical protein